MSRIKNKYYEKTQKIQKWKKRIFEENEVIEPPNLRAKNGLKIFSMRIWAMFVPKSYVVDNSPYLLISNIKKKPRVYEPKVSFLQPEEQEDKKIRIITTRTKITCPYRKSIGEREDVMTMLGFKIICERDKGYAHKCFSKRNIHHYIFSRIIPKEPSQKDRELIVMENVPNGYKIQMDWNNEEIRLFGMKTDNGWHKVNLSSETIWKERLLNMKQRALETKWFDETEQLS